MGSKELKLGSARRVCCVREHASIEMDQFDNMRKLRKIRGQARTSNQDPLDPALVSTNTEYSSLNS